MDLSAGLIVLLTFTLPAIVCNYTFQYYSRIRRPLEESVVSSTSALLLAAVFIHSCSISIIIFVDSGNLKELVAHMVEVALAGFDSQHNETALHYSGAGTDFIEDLILYNIFTMAISAIIGSTFARLSAYGVFGFELIGRLYYGGLYGTYRGFISREVWAAVLSKERIDDKSVLYSGVLEELKLKSSGQIDYITISKPYKSLISYNETIDNVKSNQPVLMGNSFEHFSHNPDSKHSEPRTLSQFDSYRLVIEGEDIANIHLERHDTRKTIELLVLFVLSKILYNEDGKIRQLLLVILILLAPIIFALTS